MPDELSIARALEILERSPSYTGSRRIRWHALPEDFRCALESLMGARVVTATSQPGGFSEGLASLLSLEDGRRVFVKAANSVDAPSVAEFHRREIAITARLSSASTPTLLDSYDDGIWVAAILAEIPGRLPAQPWRDDEFDRVLAALVELSDDLTPAPVDGALLAPRPRLGGWQALAGEHAPVPLARLQAIAPWAVDHLAELAALEQDVPSALSGDTLLHGDLYPFNVMLASDRVFVVDWPHAWIGARHCDVVTLLSSASLSGIDPQQVAERHPLTRWVTPHDIDVMLAAHAGFLLRIVVTVDAGADRNLVDTMTALGLASLRWLRSRL